MGIVKDALTKAVDFVSSEIVPIKYDLMKAGLLKPQGSDYESKANLVDPYNYNATVYGYKEKFSILDYSKARQICNADPVISAIIQTRVNQVGTFAVPRADRYKCGFKIKLRDNEKKPSASQKKKIKEMERFIMNCGYEESVYDTPDIKKKDSFEAFLRKITRDTLSFDQCTFEVVPRRNGLPAKFMAVDAATIKILPDKREKQAIWGRGYDETTQVAQNYEAYNMKYADIKQRDAENPRYVQVVNGTPRAWFDEWEMAFGVRNPRTDLLSNGYGFSEVEMLLTTITAHINAETYNRKFFSQGSSQKGILSFTGQVPPDQLESFKRQWHQQVAGVQNAWRTPIVSGGKDSELKWINLHSTNKDMEWGKYVEYLIKTICGVYQIDPMEIGFDISRNSTGGSSNGGGIGGQGQQIERLKYSKDKGLDPLLRFIANMINEYVVWRLDPEFEFEFVGLNVVGEKEQIDLDKTKIETYKTINELRAEHDLPPLKDPTDIKNAGDLVMNSNFIQAYQSLSQAGMGGEMGGGMGMEGGGEMSPDGQMGGAQDQNQEEPDYENMSDEELQAELDKLQGAETTKSFQEKVEELEIIL